MAFRACLGASTRDLNRNLLNSSSKFTVERMPAPEYPQEAECPLLRRHLSGLIAPVCLPTQRWVQKSGSARYKNLVSSPLSPDPYAASDDKTLQGWP